MPTVRGLLRRVGIPLGGLLGAAALAMLAPQPTHWLAGTGWFPEVQAATQILNGDWTQDGSSKSKTEPYYNSDFDGDYMNTSVAYLVNDETDFTYQTLNATPNQLPNTAFPVSESFGDIYHSSGSQFGYGAPEWGGGVGFVSGSTVSSALAEQDNYAAQLFQVYDTCTSPSSCSLQAITAAEGRLDSSLVPPGMTPWNNSGGGFGSWLKTATVTMPSNSATLYGVNTEVQSLTDGSATANTFDNGSTSEYIAAY